jgi:O-methyltransferase domain
MTYHFHHLVRIIRVLYGMGLYQEIAPHIYQISLAGSMFACTLPFASTVVCLYDLSTLLTLVSSLIVYNSSSHFEVFAKLSDYFESNGFQCPNDAYDGPFQFTQGKQIHHFEWLATKPKIQAAFNATMKAAHMHRGVDWFDFFPMATKFQNVASTEPLLVDIGGGLGHQLIAFKQRHPDLTGRIVLQDLPAVLDDIKELHPGIETMPHDFFKEQPIKGARAYFMRNVLHDWPDKQASLILKSIRDAMGPGSMLLIDENVLPESGVSLFSAQTDMFMMAMYSALERTESQFRALLEALEFEVVHVYDQPAGSAKVFEAVCRV